MHNEMSMFYLLMIVLVGLCSFILMGANVSSVMYGGADKLSEVPEFYSF